MKWAIEFGHLEVLELLLPRVEFDIMQFQYYLDPLANYSIRHHQIVSLIEKYMNQSENQFNDEDSRTCVVS